MTMRRPRHAILTWLLAMVFACGGVGARGGRSAVPEAAELDAETRILAPDLAARVDRARADARAADDDGARCDHEQRAELWEVAALSEAKRIRLAREREAILRDVEAIETQRAADEERRAEIARDVQREQAVRVARNEAARVFAEATEDEGRRRGGDAARTAVRREATQALLERASAIVAAAAALGAPESSVEAATRAIDGARRANDGSAASVVSAQRAWSLAQTSLGEARKRKGAPTVEERASLFEALANAGFVAEMLDEGVAIWLPSAFPPGRRDVSKGEAAVLSALGAVLTAHPHGPIQVQARVASVAQRAGAAKLLDRVTKALGGVDPARVVRDVLVASADQVGIEVRVILPAYGCAALSNANDACARGTSVVQAQSE